MAFRLGMPIYCASQCLMSAGPRHSCELGSRYRPCPQPPKKETGETGGLTLSLVWNTVGDPFANATLPEATANMMVSLSTAKKHLMALP